MLRNALHDALQCELDAPNFDPPTPRGAGSDPVVGRANRRELCLSSPTKERGEAKAQCAWRLFVMSLELAQ
jgi:hypothetical protein